MCSTSLLQPPDLRCSSYMRRSGDLDPSNVFGRLMWDTTMDRSRAWIQRWANPAIQSSPSWSVRLQADEQILRNVFSRLRGCTKNDATGFSQRFLDVNSRAKARIEPAASNSWTNKVKITAWAHTETSCGVFITKFYFNHLHEAQGLRGSRRKFKLWDELGSFGSSFEFPEARVDQHVSLTYDCILWLVKN